jgi:hypothetical protein
VGPQVSLPTEDLDRAENDIKITAEAMGSSYKIPFPNFLFLIYFKFKLRGMGTNMDLFWA